MEDMICPCFASRFLSLYDVHASMNAGQAAIGPLSAAGGGHQGTDAGGVHGVTHVEIDAADELIEVGSGQDGVQIDVL